MKNNKVASDRQLGFVLMITSSLLFAFVPNSAKVAMNEGSSLIFLIISRYAIGTLILIPIIFFTRNSFFIPRAFLTPTFLASVLALALLVATYHAVNYLDVGLVLLILYAFPIGVALISHIKGTEKINIAKWFCILFVFFGLCLMIFKGGTEVNYYGILVSIFGLFAFVFFVIVSGRLVAQIGSTTLNLHISIWGLFFLLILVCFTFDTSIAVPKSKVGIIAIISNGIFYIVSWVLFFEASRMIGVTRASLISSTEPLFAALLALILLNQVLSLVEWIGFFIVLFSIYAFEKLKS